jgi:hypothetical protein
MVGAHSHQNVSISYQNTRKLSRQKRALVPMYPSWYLFRGPRPTKRFFYSRDAG